MGKERNRLRLERDRRVSEEALPELTRLREEEQKQKESSEAPAPAKKVAVPVVKKTPEKAPSKARTRSVRKKTTKSE